MPSDPEPEFDIEGDLSDDGIEAIARLLCDLEENESTEQAR